MTAENFCYWLQGFYEINDDNTISKKQSEIIKAHLSLVFKHDIDISMFDGKDDKYKKEYSDIHDMGTLKPMINC